ncbi:hypothetical protein [Chitinophaga sancti]|uniref:Uncharacterized protein n=1 Tax=Chitinophaga sancti TaxID=1004 RepID=A0A1K1RMX5_9BACT|nr:hypothetical protein [Chitinophaga sancti]WQD62643.1 hypothetical protein U0033_32630 [Chitinophaga sancti]WQG91734.1 hypothetical protein SR876_09475 [Chitinophaga sancti]SFW73274.1 hypothetical protein SAMN05661012_03985 [Chitinophaga sancti]
MKKTLSITFIAALLAVSTAFASRRELTTWVLWNGFYKTAIASDIKWMYCYGANNQMCAVDVNNGYNLIFMP